MSITYYRDRFLSGLFYKTDGKTWWFWSKRWASRSQEWEEDMRPSLYDKTEMTEITKKEMFQEKL